MNIILKLINVINNTLKYFFKILINEIKLILRKMIIGEEVIQQLLHHACTISLIEKKIVEKISKYNGAHGAANPRRTVSSWYGRGHQQHQDQHQHQEHQPVHHH